jgi:hypothetical protein
MALLLIAPVLGAQSAVRSTTPLLAAPGGRDVATVRAGATVRTANARQGHTEVTLDGYIAASLLGPGREGFSNLVDAPRGARLRSGPSGDAAIIADLRDAMGVDVISRSGDWIRVRRTAWVASSALGPAPPPAERPAPRDSTTRVSTAAPSSGRAQPSSDALTPLGTAELRNGPGGPLFARVDSGALLTPLAHGDGWTRVRVEGWIRDEELIPADPTLQLSLSAADIRAAPDRTRGAMVRWDVQFIALQRADQLRRDLRAGEPYILARGPGDEGALLYLAVPPALLPEVEQFQPLEGLTVTARVRVGRSEPVGVPILDLLSAVRR